ncbi:DNA repair protein RecO [Peribacillus frigoritolerans]|uniref:DNA repair protein RecO n=1 Tax=Peribacillus frigoritolerans TaxID=450367 RepID=UPI001059FE01|nr:DNA repair protein RecO [Peribacillus frigoritolerans]TDL82260.1 DNA repair protein RecO [Peribacillus frigoritolerans]
MLQKCEGIVIRTNDYGETNKIVTIYTRELGKVGVMARGAKKPNSRLSSSTQLFTYGYFLFQKSSGLGGLQQGETISSMRGIREDIFLTAYASYAAELLDKSTEQNEPNPFLFELFSQTLQRLNEGVDPDVLLYIFEMKIVNVLGMYPQLDSCVNCSSKDGTFHFSIRENGFICHRCFETDPYRLQISQATAKLLRLFYYFDLERLGKVTVKPETKAELKMVIDSYYSEYSGIFLKSKKFLDQIESLKGKLT